MRELDRLDNRILELVQSDFPVCGRPFLEIAGKLGIDEPTLIRRIGRLMEQGVIRRFGAVFDSQKLGYVSTLVAARIPDPGLLASVAESVSRYDEVTHNYQREDTYNLWFTLIAGSGERIEEILTSVSSLPGVAELHSLPAEEVYKIQARFVPVTGGTRGGESL